MNRFFLIVIAGLSLGACAPQVSTAGVLNGGGVRLEPRFTGLTQPTDLRFLADGRALATEQGGRVVLLSEGAPPAVVLDLSDRTSSGGERGLLSLALHPDFAENGLLFLYGTDRAGDAVLSRAALGPETLAALDVRPLFTVPQPGPAHNGGQLQFGPDGHLYLSTGEGEYRPSWLGALPFAQDTGTPLGKLLRFRVGADGALSVPADNPFPDGEGAVWSLGLRNPWRFSFDRGTSELYLTDVGETAFEEVNVQPFGGSRGANYGWPHAEGPNCRLREGCAAFAEPALTYPHAEGCSVTGGYVYRGRAVPEFAGRYLYADFCTGVLRAARRSGSTWTNDVLLDTPFVISSFAQDGAGEVVVLEYASGTVYQIVPAD